MTRIVSIQPTTSTCPRAACRIRACVPISNAARSLRSAMPCGSTDPQGPYGHHVDDPQFHERWDHLVRTPLQAGASKFEAEQLTHGFLLRLVSPCGHPLAACANASQTEPGHDQAKSYSAFSFTSVASSLIRVMHRFQRSLRHALTFSDRTNQHKERD